MRRSIADSQCWPTIAILILLLLHSTQGQAEPPAGAVTAFDNYVAKLESRLAQQHRSPHGFVALVGSDARTDASLRRGEFIIEQLTPQQEADLHGAQLHHWRGTAFVRGASAADFEALMRNFSAYPQRYSPQVMQARLLSGRAEATPAHFIALMRVRQHHVITVVMDTTYDIVFSQLDRQHGYSISRSTSVKEISAAGTPREHALAAGDEHGFLWRMNTYWSYEERDGGLYMQIESVTLSRAIPVGLGWIVGPYVNSVPRESLEFTLRATCNALRK